MDLGLEGKVGLVVASSKGLGKACAAGLAAEGAFDGFARRGLERIAEPLSRLASRPRGDRTRSSAQAGETGDRLKVVP